MFKLATSLFDATRRIKAVLSLYCVVWVKRVSIKLIIAGSSAYLEGKKDASH